MTSPGRRARSIRGVSPPASASGPGPAGRSVSAAVARRFLVRRHLLAPPRSLPPGPESVLAVVDRLGSLQFDPLEIAGRNHDLVLLARVADYRRSITDTLLYEDRALFEAYNKGLSILPVAELPFHRITWDRHHVAHSADTFDIHAPLVEELLERIRTGGRLSSTDVEPRAAIEWYWRPTNQVRAVLEALAEAGILGIAAREGNRRVYDLAERLFPAELLAIRPPEREQYRHRLLTRYRANGLLGASGQAEIFLGLGPGNTPFRAELRAELVEMGELLPVVVEGVRGVRLVISADVPVLDAAEAEVEGTNAAPGIGDPGAFPGAGVAFLAPLDPLVWDRELLRQLYDFDYVWEVYVPEKKRRWGYYVLPILFGDRLVGRLEPRIDRKAGALRILDFWWQDGFDPLLAPGFVEGLVRAIRAHQAFGGVPKILLPRTARHRPLVRAIRERLG